MSKYINPYTDFGFKKLFGSELNNKFARENLWDIANGMDTAEKKGIKKGLEMGREEGEKQKAIAIARKLKAAGVMTNDEIAKMTDLTPDEIDKI